MKYNDANQIYCMQLLITKNNTEASEGDISSYEEAERDIP